MPDSQPLIAVIDDDPEIRACLARLLASSGYHVETYASAESFLVCSTRCQARLLIIDVQLGDISGFELARQLTADGLSFSIIFMTGQDDAGLDAQSLAAGGLALLRKPFPTRALNETIEKALTPNGARH